MWARRSEHQGEFVQGLDEPRFDPFGEESDQLYVPGAGWSTFDPTNRSVGGFNLIPVAVARDIRQAMPMTGSFVGATDAFQGMTVEVLVTSQPGPILGA
jgi:hypothetical protein